jgi:hypothetical protein
VTAASGADQPTLRDQLGQQVLVTLLRTDNEPNSGKLALEVADALLPLIEADRERAKAEGGAEALEQAHRFALLNWNEDNVWLVRRAASLRATTGQPPDGTPVP